MSATSITVLLPDLPQSAGEHAALIDATAALAAEHGCSLDLVQLCGPGDDAQTPMRDSVTTSVVHWQAHHTTATGNDDATVLAVLFDAALGAIERAAVPASPNTAGQRRICVLPPGPLGDEIAATLAARSGGTSFGRCEALDLDGDHVIAHKQAFGGRIAAAVRTAASLCFATLRARPDENSHAEAEANANSQAAVPANVCHIELAVDLPPEVDRNVLPNADALPRLEGARAVVSGGRGIGGTEGFALLADVATELDAALGGSLPAVDAGWVPVARQVGQSGKFVAPRVYLAVGISGTLQHLAGVAPSTAIVAVNSDPEAPIFQVAQVGVVADWHTLLPALVTALRQGAD